MFFFVPVVFLLAFVPFLLLVLMAIFSLLSCLFVGWSVLDGLGGGMCGRLAPRNLIGSFCATIDDDVDKVGGTLKIRYKNR